jgi:hypothetical protein
MSGRQSGLRVVAQGFVLEQVVNRIDAESIDATPEPEVECAQHRRGNVGVAPVQVRLRRRCDVKGFKVRYCHVNNVIDASKELVAMSPV